MRRRYSFIAFVIMILNDFFVLFCHIILFICVGDEMKLHDLLREEIDTSIFKEMLEEITHPKILNEKNCLWEASKRGHENIAKMLLEAGAAPNGNPGENPLFEASRLGHENIVTMILDNGGNPNGDNADNNPLWVAADCGHKNIVQILIAFHADADDCLWQASHGGHENVVRTLLSAGAAPNGIAFKNPLYEASRLGHENIVTMILEHGGNPNGDNGGQNPLWVASAIGRKNIVQILLDFHANPDGYQHNNPLREAVTRCRVEVVCMLLQAGANPDGYGENKPIDNLEMCKNQEKAKAIKNILLQGHAAPAKMNKSISPLPTTPEQGPEILPLTPLNNQKPIDLSPTTSPQKAQFGEHGEDENSPALFPITQEEEIFSATPVEVTNNSGKVLFDGHTFSAWLKKDDVQQWLKEEKDLDLKGLFISKDRKDTFTAKSHGWRWESLGGAPSDYIDRRKELMQRFNMERPHATQNRSTCHF